MSDPVFRNQDFDPPDELRTDEFVVRPLLVSDTELDYEAVMETREFLRTWSQEPWPEDTFTVEANRKDMVTAEKWFADRYAFLYTVMNPSETECLGCVYIFPPDAKWLQAPRKDPVADARWSDYDAVVTFWVRASRLADGLDRRLLDALRAWFAAEWPLASHLIHTNEELEPQVTMIEAAGLQVMFQLVEPDEPVISLAYASPRPARARE